MITYPRTDSRYLPEDYIPTVKATLSKIENPHARKVLDSQWVKPSKRIFNNAKISDHFAIVPTGTVPHGLDEVQQKIYDMIVRRFIAVFFPPAQFEVTTRITRVDKDAFKTEGKIIKDPGWLAVYGRERPALMTKPLRWSRLSLTSRRKCWISRSAKSKPIRRRVSMKRLAFRHGRRGQTG